MAAFLLAACAPTRHRLVKDADGDTNVLIKCDKNKPDKCKRRAGEVCRGDYAVVEDLQPDPRSSMELMMTVHCTRIVQ
jgi:hypothetical protein